MLAKDAAPFDVLGLSPSLVLILAGIIVAGVFFVQQHRRAAAGRTVLVSPGTARSTASRRALVVVAITLGVNAGFGYLLPTYLQVVQGYGSLDTAIRMLHTRWRCPERPSSPRS